ncbi:MULTISPECIES: hypothetical protein [Aeribacillus]|uniref:Uncharacterized protein n=1 Tax=Aeribacillus pallidus TaxID=33936 RepID=A0A165XUL1_9BACI|nr:MULTISPECIES: hypothetical protein [Aeribacillus]KZN96424.1 hypothetical protein AZI98_08700 [Aeribacillus pallidus]MED0650754.1 hypothetical protein [Aeribacillus composti]MED4487946.1 hypothetical protein [Aeribacillus pallidus]
MCGLFLLVSLSAFYFLNSEENVRQKDQESTNEASNGKSNESNLSSTNTGQQNEETAENNEDELSLFISRYHDVFNQLTNRVQYQNIDWEKFQELGNDLIGEINNILSKDVSSEYEISRKRKNIS